MVVGIWFFVIIKIVFNNWLVVRVFLFWRLIKFVISVWIFFCLVVCWLKWVIIILVNFFLVGDFIFKGKYCCKKGVGKFFFLLLVIIIRGKVV